MLLVVNVGGFGIHRASAGERGLVTTDVVTNILTFALVLQLTVPCCHRQGTVFRVSEDISCGKLLCARVLSFNCDVLNVSGNCGLSGSVRGRLLSNKRGDGCRPGIVAVSFRALTDRRASTAMGSLRRCFDGHTPAGGGRCANVFRNCGLIRIATRNFSCFTVSGRLAPALCGVRGRNFGFAGFCAPV